MAMIKMSQGQRIVKRGEKMSALYLIVQGKVRQVMVSDSLIMESGNLIGFIECRDGMYLNDYFAEEACVLFSFPFEKPEDFSTIFASQEKYALAFLQAAVRQTLVLLESCEAQSKSIKKFYTVVMAAYRQLRSWNYNFSRQEHFVHRMEEMEKFDLKLGVDSWEINYFRALSGLSGQELDQFYKKKDALIIGEVMRASEDMMHAVELIENFQKYLKYNQELLLGDNKVDLLTLYLEQCVIAAKKDENFSASLHKLDEIKAYIQQSKFFDDALVKRRLTDCEKFDFEAIRKQAMEERELLEQQDEEEAEDCLVHILDYAGYEQEEIEQFRVKVTDYRNMEDPFSTEEPARRLRKEVEKVFYDAYKKVFFRSVTEGEELSPILQMFMCFGFMDLQTAGEENANDLYDMTDRLFECKSEHIYTMYDWLMGIYQGAQEPSRNEFDLDYLGYLHEERRIGRITMAQEEEMRNDNWEKVNFELDNMFLSANRITYGKISTFCPIISKNDVIGNIENMLVTVEKLENALNAIRKLDFSLFYHEVIFTDPQHGVNMELLQKEILPNIILMPNIGTRAMMWQETAGVKRDTSARFILPIMTIGNIDDMMMETCGRYRWEMCRKIQGMRWNDITDKSLTSEYCDYIQFYRKNQNLSVESKEKIKNALTRAKNNFREIFTMDYCNWMKYESNGSFRLNKVSRDILFRYCPFPKAIRTNLEDNPMYQDMFSKYNILLERKKRHVKQFTDKYIKSGGEMTVDLQENMEFYNM